LSDSHGQETKLVEWNGYRYVDYTDSLGHKGVLLFGMSKRARGDDVLDFLRNLGTAKMVL
jgi:hypothetical protein